MSTSTSTDFAIDAPVWVKQPDYPWWPAIVLDPAQAGQELPEGSDVVLLCGPSAAATLAFANSHDAEQLRPFRGVEADADLIAAGRGADEGCAAAIDEMIATAAAAGSLEAGEAGSAELAPAAQETAAEDDGAARVAESAERHAKKHKKDKKEKSRKHGDSRSGAEKEKKSHRRHRKDDDSEDEGDSDYDEREDSGNDDDLFQRRNGASSSRAAAVSAKKAKYERQSKLEEYDLGPATHASEYNPRNDPAYLYRKVRDARRAASSAELMACTQELRTVMARCLSGAATAAAVEAEILAVLRGLTNVNVTVRQLQETGVGVAVGGLLRSFTPPVVQLAHGILTYWFHSLPQNTQEQLSAENEVDRCSVETCSDGVAGDNELGRIGVNLFGCFTNEEINDAPASVDVMALCGQLEDTLESRCDADAQRLVLSAFGDSGDTGKALRRLVLEGKIIADDIVRHADNLATLARTRQRRPANIQFALNSPPSLDGGSGIGSPTSPYDVYSPNEDGAPGSPSFGSPTGRTTTALFSCPHCGANDAYQSSYSVQAHDNMPDILRCKKCGQTWNVAEQ